MKAKNKRIIFKPYHQNQVMALPPSLEELIPSNHQVRLINMIIERLNVEPLIKDYQGGGTSSYHPKMLLKVLIYGYTQHLYSSRRIAKALRENINFMWLAGGNRPDFRTINRFRSSRLKGTIEEVFTAVVEFLIDEGLVNLQDYFLDGTKIEANASRYSYVWKKTTQRLQAKLQEQVHEVMQQIETSHEGFRGGR
jgi:transposase